MRRPTVRILAATLLAGFVALCADPPATRGQPRLKPAVESKTEEPQFTDAVTLPRNPESRRLIQAAQDYVKKKEWRIAGECLQSLLDSPEDSFIEVTRRNEAGQETKLKISVRTEANRIIGELPSDGLESYRLQYGPTAEDRLKEALQTADPAILAEVSQRYQHTDAGLKATDLLGTYHLDRGQYLMAALCYERLLGRADSDKLPPKVLFKAALAYRRAGMTAQADPLFAKFAEAARKGDVAFGKAKPGIDTLRTEFGREVGLDSVAGLFDWPVFRGNPQRSAQGLGGSAYLEPRWNAKLTQPEETVHASDKAAVNWVDQHLDTALAAMRDKPVLPSFFPIAANGKVFVRAYDGVAAYALKATDDGTRRPGELLWRSFANHSLFRVVRDDARGGRMAFDNWYNTYYRQSNIGPMGIAFEHSVLGALSHDGQRVYYIDDLAIPPHPTMMMSANFGGASVSLAPFTQEAEHNQLLATNIEDGKVAWELGGRQSGPPIDPKDGKRELNAASELLDTFFLGPPLPLGGKLYCLTEKNTELRLICLDPSRPVASALNPIDRCPELVWVQPLGTANTKIKADGLRRTHVAHLAYGDGILVCPTNAGAVLGIDLLSHSLVWAFSYRKVVQQNTDEVPFRRRFNPTTALATGERWRPSAPCIVGGRVVFTAPDGVGSEVHCLSLRTGQSLWSVKRDEANDLYLAGVFGDRVLIVARNHVRALALDTGKEVWRESATGVPSGQGTASEGVYYLPLASSADPRSSDKGPEICALDIKTGAIVGRSKARKEAPGNLVFLEGELVSQSARTVTVFPQLKIKQKEIDLALAKNPDDAGGLTERGELNLYNGAVKEAVADLRRALAGQPPAEVKDKARSRLHEALTTLLQKDFGNAEQYLPEYSALCKVEIPESADAEKKQKLVSEQVRRQATYWELLGRGREKQGRAVDAFVAYEQYGALAGHKELVESLEEPHVRARPDIWSRGRIQALLAAANATDRGRIESEINGRWEKVRTAGKLDELRKFVSLYGPISSAGQAARIELAERLMKSGEPDELAEAERILASLVFSAAQRRDDPTSAIRASDLMIALCLRRGQYENAIGFYRQLADEFPDRVIRDGKTGRQLFEELQYDKRYVPYLDSPAVVWTGVLAGKRVQGAFQNRDMSVTVVPAGDLLPFYDRHRLVLDMRLDGGQSPWSLRVLDRATGDERWRITGLPAANYLYSGQANQPFAFARGHQLILHLNQRVIAYDLMERKELWSYNLLGKDGFLTNQMQNYAYDPQGGVFITQQEEEKNIYLGRVAVVEAAYIGLLTRQGFVAIDPTRPGPSILWQKSDVSARARAFGDDKHVFLFEPDAPAGRPKFQALRASDGAPVKCHNFAEYYQKKIATLGGRILVSETQGKALRLIDALTGVEIWRRDFAPKSVVVKCDDPKLTGAIEPGGLFTLLDSRTGAVQLTSRLGPDRIEGLQEAQLLADRDRYFLALSNTAERGVSWNCAASFGLRSVRVNGPLYALSRRTGKLEWACDFLPHQTLLTEQWADLPVLVFASEFNKSAANGTIERQGVRVTAVNKATGKLVFDDDKLLRQGQFHALTANPSAGRVELIRNDVKVVLATPEGAAMPEPAGPPAPNRPINLRINPGRVPVPIPPAPGG